MNKTILRRVFLVCLTLSLSACFGPKTPQEVTQTFWKAVLGHDARNAVKYSTLADEKQYDAFSRDWTGYQASWGRVVIDGNEASVVSEFTAPANSGHQNRKFVTYLVKQDEAWKVDYDRTRMAVRGGVLGSLLDSLGQLGDDLSRQMSTSADNFKIEMDRMSKKLEQMADSFNAEATKSINKYAEELQQSIEDLEQSINRALNDDNDMSDKDRQVLQGVAGDLHRDSEDLARPTVESISRSSSNIGKTQQQLDALNSDSINKYKKEWRTMTRKIEADMRKMLDELASMSKDKSY